MDQLHQKGLPMAPCDSWVTESNVTTQTIAAVLIIATGTALAIGFRHFEGPGLTGSLAGFLLGILLLVVGFGGLLFGGKQVITVDTRRRQIIIEGRNRFKTGTKVVPFDKIADVYVGEFGDQEGGSISYHVVVRLKMGKEIRLFFGFFSGQYDKSVAEARCQRLVQCLRAGG